MLTTDRACALYEGEKRPVHVDDARGRLNHGHDGNASRASANSLLQYNSLLWLREYMTSAMVMGLPLLLRALLQRAEFKVPTSNVGLAPGVHRQLPEPRSQLW